MIPDLLLFCLAAGALIVTPGPNFLYVLTRGTTQGRRAGLLAALGLGVGVMLHTMLAAIGVSALIRSSYVVFEIIRFTGSLYLIYLGVTALRLSENHRRELLDPVSGWRIVWQSVVASMTNPKTILFFLSFLPQFVDSRSSHVARQLLLLGGIYMLLTVMVYGLVAYSSGHIGHWMRTRATVASRLRWVTGASFIGLGVWAALPERR
jgi:threonine/homoserine/homoserine lactone efflux protein